MKGSESGLGSAGGGARESRDGGNQTVSSISPWDLLMYFIDRMYVFV